MAFAVVVDGHLLASLLPSVGLLPFYAPQMKMQTDNGRHPTTTSMRTTTRTRTTTSDDDVALQETMKPTELKPAQISPGSLAAALQYPLPTCI